MTSDRIRWCMACNLIVASRKCPECRNDVYNLHIDGKSRISPVFKYHIQQIRSALDARYGEGCGQLLIPDERTALLQSFPDHRRIIINGGEVGRITNEGDVALNASGLRIISPGIKKNYVRCDHDSSFFVTKGRNLMVTGITEHSKGLKEGDAVAIFDEKGTPISDGIMKMGDAELDSSDKGMAVRTRFNELPRVYEGRSMNDWMQTVDSNKVSIGALAGDAVRNIKDVQMSYKYPVVVELAPDVVSEANLLLTLEAGYKPSVLVKEESSFVNYLIEKHGLTRISELPDKCFLITDNDKSDDENIFLSPTSDWDPVAVWLYIMLRSEPFDPAYMQS